VKAHGGKKVWNELGRNRSFPTCRIETPSNMLNGKEQVEEGFGTRVAKLQEERGEVPVGRCNRDSEKGIGGTTPSGKRSPC